MTTRTILLPIDGSSNSERAFHYYCEEIKKDGDLLLLLHVQMPPNLSSAGGFVSLETMSVDPESWANLIDEQIQHSKKVTENYEKLCKTIQMDYKMLTGVGGAGEIIVEFAKRHDAKLIVIGSRGLNRIRRTFLGSVSDYVIHHTHIPVLVTPPPEHPHKL